MYRYFGTLHEKSYFYGEVSLRTLFRPSVRTGAPSPKGKARALRTSFTNPNFGACAAPHSPYGGTFPPGKAFSYPLRIFINSSPEMVSFS